MPHESEQPDTVILAGGSYPSGRVAAALLAHAARVVCCDGAVDGFAARGGVPEAVVGDCDSISDGMRRRFADIIHCDPDQETNDLTKAVRLCLARGWRHLTILGATGGREDHALGNISLLADYTADGIDAQMVTDTGVFTAVSTDATFESYAGQQVSIFTLASDTLITTVGLRYPLVRAPLAGWWRGTLNESEGARFTILTTGPAIIYRRF